MQTLSFPFRLPIWKKVSAKALFYILSIIFVGLFLSYAYLVNRTIMNVVSREKTQNSISNLSSDIGGLESNYLSLKNSVTMDLAYKKGFQDANPDFISRNRGIAYISTR